MNTCRKLSYRAAALIILVVLALPTVSAQAPSGPAFALAPAVLVGGEDFPSSAWIADEVGRVAAVNLDNGVMKWRGPAEGLPLAMIDNQLVVLGRPERSGQLRLLLLDPTSGSSLGTLIGELPDAVLASPFAQPNRTFRAVADSSSGALRVLWSYTEWPLRGALLVNDANPGAGHVELSGVAAIDLSTHSLQSTTTADAPVMIAADLTGDQRIPGLAGTQFRSADGAHAQLASPVEDDVLGTAWRWSLHERSSGRAVSQLRMPYAHAPFMLRDNRLIWQSPPVAERQASGEFQVQALRLVCQELVGGRELWSLDLLETEYSGVLPP